MSLNSFSIFLQNWTFPLAGNVGDIDGNSTHFIKRSGSVIGGKVAKDITVQVGCFEIRELKAFLKYSQCI